MEEDLKSNGVEVKTEKDEDSNHGNGLLGKNEQQKSKSLPQECLLTNVKEEPTDTDVPQSQFPASNVLQSLLSRQDNTNTSQNSDFNGHGNSSFFTQGHMTDGYTSVNPSGTSTLLGGVEALPVSFTQGHIAEDHSSTLVGGVEVLPVSFSQANEIERAVQNVFNEQPLPSTSSGIMHLQTNIGDDATRTEMIPPFMYDQTLFDNNVQATSSVASQNPFKIDSSLIAAIPTSMQDNELQSLGLTVYNQDQFEQGVIAQVDHVISKQEKDRGKKAAEKLLKSLEQEIRVCKQEIKHSEKVAELLEPKKNVSREIQRRLISVKQQKENKQNQLKKMKAKQKCLLIKINGSSDGIDEADEQTPGSNEPELTDGYLVDALGLGEGQSETVRNRMIRTGEMTPFGSVTQTQPPPPPRKLSLTESTDFDMFLKGQDTNVSKKKLDAKKKNLSKKKKAVKSIQSPAFAQSSKSQTGSTSSNKNKEIGDDFARTSQKVDFNHRGINYFDHKDKRRYHTESDYSASSARKRKDKGHSRLQHNFSEDRALSDVEVGDEMDEEAWGEDEWRPTQHELQQDEDMDDIPEKKFLKRKIANNKKGLKKQKSHLPEPSTKDDGDDDSYDARIRNWKLEKEVLKQEKREGGEDNSDDDSDAEFEGGLKIPAKIYKKLYRYQKTGVKWLWELHCQQAGGVLGDEMGLGKTIQIIAFCVAMRHSKIKENITNLNYTGLGPVIIVCPATVMSQWVKEFHKWWPEFRVSILHSSGSFKTSPGKMVRNLVQSNGILVTSFSSLVIHQDLLLNFDWHYIILDEGHKIRNPDAQVTIAAKQFRTCHRLILSGSPVQNNLKELWSVFDFVFPGKLGTLPDFMQHFSVPIIHGGYASATEVQVQTSYKCACVLRDTINPYLLRRMKADVKGSLQLPDKNEQVLFCRLTEHQREVYSEYLNSKECQMILSGNFMVFPGLITLRKICNHPDLSTGGPRVFDSSLKDSDPKLNYGHWQRSGKMIVVESLLKLWKKQGHKVLLFSQSKEMLKIIEEFAQINNYSYLRMDGGTNISSRQPLVSRFNQDDSIFLFLLTTRVGGLGINLTGANRIIIYDPDWNPSTDTQARERSWRIGQKRQVTVYRLLTTGTIEEKIYHRQIFKQFLINRVLKDPKQRRFFKANDLHELFTLTNDNPNDGTETSAIFAGTGSDVRVKNLKKKNGSSMSEKVNRFDLLKEKKVAEEKSEEGVSQEEIKTLFGMEEEKDTSDKVKKMLEMARMLSKKVANSKGKNPVDNNHAKAVIDRTDSPQNVSELVSGSNSVVTESVVTNNVTEMVNGHSKDTNKRSKKKKSKKKKKKKNVSLDGEEISHLSKLSKFNDRKDDDEGLNKPEMKDDASMDDYVLRRLLKKSGVHSALQHDRIMMASNPDYALVEGEAEKVASDAAKALKKSRARCMAASLGTPTWTGNRGQAGAPKKPRFGIKKKSSSIIPPSAFGAPPAQPKTIPSEEKTNHFDGSTASAMMPGARNVRDEGMSSDELLSRMQNRNHVTRKNGGNDEDDDELPLRDVETRYLDLITDMRNYVACGALADGQASTQELLDQFGPRVPPSDSAKFRAILKQICQFDKVNDVGMWRLKTVFR